MKLCCIAWWPVMQVERAWVWIFNWDRYSDSEGELKMMFCKSLRDSMITMKYNYSYTLKNDATLDIENCFQKVDNYGCRKPGEGWGL